MPATVPQLELFRPPKTNPNVDWFINLLFLFGKSADALETQGWMNSAGVIAKAGFAEDDDGDRRPRLNDREVRSLAEAAAPKIISGQRGYKHTDHATAEEIKMCINTLESQGTKMMSRAHKIRTYAHAKIG